jgi:hypothetical protein
MRRHRIDALFLTQVYSGSKFCPSVLETVGLRVPPRRICDFALFSVCSSCKKCPSARCASAANAVCSDDHVFVSRNILLRHILQDSWLYFIVLFLLSYHYYYYYYYYYTLIFLILILSHYYFIIMSLLLLLLLLYCIALYYCTYTVLCL